MEVKLRVHLLAKSQVTGLDRPTLWPIVLLTHKNLQQIQILKQIVFDAPGPQCSWCHFELK